MTNQEKEYLRANLYREAFLLLDSLQTAADAGQIGLALETLETVGSMATNAATALESAGFLLREINKQERLTSRIQNAEAKLRNLGLLNSVEFVD